jgi:hypothetical protein
MGLGEFVRPFKILDRNSDPEDPGHPSTRKAIGRGRLFNPSTYPRRKVREWGLRILRGPTSERSGLVGLAGESGLTTASGGFNPCPNRS